MAKETGKIIRETLFWYVQEGIACILRCTLLPLLLREIFARKKVTIVDYHNPSPIVFRRHVKWLCRKYNIISMDQLQTCLDLEDYTSLPPKSMVITLDDGWAENRHLFPIIKEFGIPVVIYMVSGLVDTPKHYWSEFVPNGHIKKMLISCPDAERQEWLRQNANLNVAARLEGRSALTSLELEEFMRLKGTVGSHTVSHPIMTQCDGDVRRREVVKSKDDLEKMSGANVNYFAYPNGSWNKYVREEVEQAGYLNARTIHFGWVTQKSDKYALPCIGISDRAGLNKGICQASGLWQLLFRQQERITEK